MKTAHGATLFLVSVMKWAEFTVRFQLTKGPTASLS